MDEDVEIALSERLWLHVAAGRESLEALREELVADLLAEEGLEDDPEAEEWALGELSSLWDAHAAEAAAWPRPTDVDRLERAFAALEAEDWLTDGPEGSGVTQSDVLDDLTERAEGGAAPYAGFHLQDIEGALGGAGLWLMHGRLGPDGAATPDARIAARLCEALRAEGLSPEWDGDPARRVHLPALAWRRAAPVEG